MSTDIGDDFFSPRREVSDEDYRICGVPPGTEFEKVRESYRKLAAVHHASADRGFSSEFQRLERAFSRIQASERKRSDEAGSSKANSQTETSSAPRPDRSPWDDAQKTSGQSTSTNYRPPPYREPPPTPPRDPTPPTTTEPGPTRFPPQPDQPYKYPSSPPSEIPDERWRTFGTALAWLGFFAGPWLIMWSVVLSFHGSVSSSSLPAWKEFVAFGCGIWFIATIVVVFRMFSD
jgi:hypothetical protein